MDTYRDVDLKLDPATNDLALTRLGTLDYWAGSDTAPNAVIRRAGTSIDGYARMVRVGNTVSVQDANYYSDLPQLLSSPINNVDSLMTEELEEVSAADGRLSVQDISVVQTGPTTLQLDMTYILPGSYTPTTFTSVL